MRLIEFYGQSQPCHAPSSSICSFASFISPDAVSQPFMMPVEDVFSKAGRGTIITGAVKQGTVSVGDEIELVGMNKDGRTVRTTVTGVEMFRKVLDRGEAGDNLGALVRGLKRDEVRRGMVACKPGTQKAHTRFAAKVYALTPEEGGRSKQFTSRYTPQFFFRTADITGKVQLPDDKPICMPGMRKTPHATGEGQGCWCSWPSVIPLPFFLC